MLRDGEGGGRERRGSRRIPVALTGHCQIGHRYVREAIHDMSLGGLYLRTREVAREGTPVRVAVALPAGDGPQFCTFAGLVARVARDDTGYQTGLGVRFAPETTNGADLRCLAEYLSAKPTSERER